MEMLLGWIWIALDELNFQEGIQMELQQNISGLNIKGKFKNKIPKWDDTLPFEVKVQDPIEILNAKLDSWTQSVLLQVSLHPRLRDLCHQFRFVKIMLSSYLKAHFSKVFLRVKILQRHYLRSNYGNANECLNGDSARPSSTQYSSLGPEHSHAK